MSEETKRNSTATASAVACSAMVGPTDVKYIKHCCSCGKYLKRHRWMIVGGYDYNHNRRPICWDCDASYE